MFGGVLCARPKNWLLSSHLLISHGSAAHHRQASGSNLVVSTADSQRLLNHSITNNGLNFNLNFSGGYRSASVWHAVLPAAGSDRGSPSPVGEGSWNVAWDVRPARWLHRPHTAWLLFGICACLAAPPLEVSNGIAEPDDKIDGSCTKTVSENSSNYKIIGVPADGRCLFRAIAHMVCLRNGEEAPNEDRQKELADELRAQVVDELLKRRKETEWFIEGDFDEYVKRIEKPFVWGGEPELLMASHILKTTISVFMLDRSSQSLLNIATYGKEYQKDGESAIKVLFHGYGHYDILEDIS